MKNNLIMLIGQHNGCQMCCNEKNHKIFSVKKLHSNFRTLETQVSTVTRNCQISGISIAVEIKNTILTKK